MTTTQSALSRLAEELRDDPGLSSGDVLKHVLTAALQDLIDTEATERIGAAPYQHTDTRVTHRNGTRPKTVETPAGQVTVEIPKLRAGSFFPSLLNPRRRVDRALWAVIAQAWVNGVSTRKVDRLVKALGCQSGISKSSVSRVCAEIDQTVDAFLTRRLDTTWYPYVYVDATFVHTREHGRVVSQAVVVATGVGAGGRRTVLGMDVGDTESAGFWTAFLRSLRARGLAVAGGENKPGVMLVISDAHCGIRTAIQTVLPGAAWQRCRTHFARDVTGRLGTARSKPVNALISTVFAEPDPAAVRAAYRRVTDSLAGSFPQIAAMLEDAEADLTAFCGFPRTHWTKIWSNNPIERLNREIKRRAEVVQIFPDRASVRRLIGAVLAEIDEEWQYGERRYMSAASLARLAPEPQPEQLPDAPTKELARV